MDTSHRGHLLRLPPNRVWRTYPGGRTLDLLAGAAAPEDGPFPEHWVGSTVRARNVGREELVEGPARVQWGKAGEREADWTDLLRADGTYLLGTEHLATFGPEPGVLVKLLDPAIRLHFQVHPTRSFARARLGQPSGKEEAYHLLAVRPEEREPHLYLGWREVPTRQKLKRWIEEQDLMALAAAMNRVPVRPGDTLVVPGGVPHALGGGLLLVELQEPSDLAVRFEYERGGHVLPEAARFLGRGLEFCLEVFAAEPTDPQRLAPPVRRIAEGAGWWRDELIGPTASPCFRLRRVCIQKETTWRPAGFALVVVAEGRGTVEAPGGTVTLAPGSTWAYPAGLDAVTVSPHTPLVLLECQPPEPSP
jgi:mannose-6-phosphate isomerase